MRRDIIGLSIVAGSLLFYAGCGSSGGDTTTPVAPAPAPTVVTGTAFYVDAPVEGVTATCGSTVSTTDAQGSFTFQDGQSCTFTFGDVLLREQAGIIEGQFILEDVLRVAQFLQSLDNDNDPSNGITLTAEVLAQMTKDGVVTLPDSDEALAELVVRLQQANIGYGGDFVSGPQAQAHIDATRQELAPVGDNKPPVAVAGDDFTVESGTTIKLDGGKSKDPDGTIAKYSWAEKTNQGNPRNSVIGEFGGLDEGKHTFILTVTDDKGATATDEVVVTINAKPKPVLKSTLKKTGQTTSYTPYDDGHYQIGVARSYTRNANETVTDNVTGLIWQDNATPATMTWQQAIDYCDALDFAGSTEWRLPTMDELVYITDKGKSEPAIDVAFQNTASDIFENYWSSTTASADDTDYIRIIEFSSGGEVGGIDKSSNNHVRCVSGAVAQASTFTRDNATEIVTDTQTHLQWQDDAAAASTKLSWQEAIDHCAALKLGGKDDWRLPNFNELYYVADRSSYSPELSSAFAYVTSDHYWSATTLAGNTSYAWIVYFNGAHDAFNDKSSSYYVRCVR